MSLFTSRTGRRLERLEGELAETRTGLLNELAEIAKAVQELRETQLPNFERVIALRDERNELAASDEILRDELDAARTNRDAAGDRAAELTERLDAATRNYEDLKQQLAAMRRAVKPVVKALVSNESQNKPEATADMLLEHAEALGLSPEERKAVAGLVPTVTVLLSYGSIESVHRTTADAKAASCCGPLGWVEAPSLTGETALREACSAVVHLPVRGLWIDRSRVVLVLDADGWPQSARAVTPGFEVSRGVEIFPVLEPVVAA